MSVARHALPYDRAVEVVTLLAMAAMMALAALGDGPVMMPNSAHRLSKTSD
jgi:hypothetical protein